MRKACLFGLGYDLPFASALARCARVDRSASRLASVFKRGVRTISERNFETMTKAEVIAAQRAGEVCCRTRRQAVGLYDFGAPDEPLLFADFADVIRLDRLGLDPTSSVVIRITRTITGSEPGWKAVEFQRAAGPILKAGGLGYKDMGHYTFIDADGNATRADYTFAYHKLTAAFYFCTTLR